MYSDSAKMNSNPRATCSMISAFTLFWTLDLFKKGSKIELSDVYEPLKEHESAYLGEKAWLLWNKEMEKRTNAKVYRVIFQLFKWEIIIYFIFALLRECIVRVAQPVFLGYFMSYYVSNQHSITVEQSTLAAIAFVACTLVYSIFCHPCAMGVSHLGMKYRATLSALIFRKSLRLSHKVGNDRVGQLTNLLSNDMRRFEMGTVLLNYLIVSPIQLCIMTYFIWKEIGISSLIGLIILILQIPIQFKMSTTLSQLRSQIAKLTDKRLQLINEIVTGIQVIKMFSWEDVFTKQVNTCRENEVNKIKQSFYLRAINMSLSFFSTRLCIFASLVCYVLFGNVLDAQKAFVVVCFYEILKQTMAIWFPQSITQIKELMVTFERFDSFLKIQESSYQTIVHEKVIINDEAAVPLLSKTDVKYNSEAKTVSISENVSNDSQNLTNEIHDSNINNNETTDNILVLTNVQAKSSNTLSIKNISLSIPKGRLVAVTGHFASGKSSLLLAILKEIDIVEGTVECNGSLSYSSQVPWLFAGTVQDNIIFGSLKKDKQDKKYEDVYRACGLEDEFENTDMVGDRGSNLSGGQRGRINLARTVYRDADIYLLDDPLSAVDATIGKQIFDNCIKGMLLQSGKTVVLVTHQEQYLNQADMIIVMENGCIKQIGTPQSILGCITYTNLTENSGLDVKVNSSVNKSYVKEENKEDKIKGKVVWSTYRSYIRACGKRPILLLFMTLAVSSQILASGFDYWTKHWVNSQESKLNLHDNKLSQNVTNISTIESSLNEKNSTTSFEPYFSNHGYIIIFTCILLSLIIFTLCRTIMFYWMAMRASLRLHEAMLKSVIGAIMKFFHQTATGKIWNRFSQDIGAIDDLLPLLVIEVVQISLQLLGVIILVSIVNTWLLLVMVVVIVSVYWLNILYLKTSRSVVRCQAAACSLVFDQINATIRGLATIRSMSAEDVVTKQFDYHNNVYNSASYMKIGVLRTFAYWLDLVCVTFIAIVTLSFLSTDVIGGNIGLAITQVIGLITVLQWGVRQAADLENQMISVERIQEFSNNYPEPPLEIETDKSLNSDWPLQGKIKAEELFLYYSETDRPSLNGISFEIDKGEKIGVVGETGAGKSSLINVLFRLYKFDGKISIDDMDITKIGLKKLRTSMCIIPQEPILFSGTIRQNLDPLGEYKDTDLYNALEQVKLKEKCTLEDLVSTNGNNFSVGERQLFCLARSIIRKNKIIILDEATANVDNDTDDFIKATLKKNFSDCTIITIAHRLKTVIDYDKIFVMDSGKLVENGKPSDLLRKRSSKFYLLAKAAGIQTEALQRDDPNSNSIPEEDSE